MGAPLNRPPIKLDRLADVLFVAVEDGTYEVVVLLRFMEALEVEGTSFVDALLGSSQL